MIILFFIFLFFIIITLRCIIFYIFKSCDYKQLEILYCKHIKIKDIIIFFLLLKMSSQILFEFILFFSNKSVIYKKKN